jgi:uncharacterized protein YndB with AHSA1/START domain
MATFTLEADAAAPPETVFEVVSDHRRYAEISRVRKSELEREGEPPPNGVGAIRVLHSVGPPLREEIVEYVPPSRLKYTLLSGAPLRDHFGTVDLAPGTSGGTHITYRIDTTPKIPLLGGLAVRLARVAVQQLLDGIVRESERRAG